MAQLVGYLDESMKPVRDAKTGRVIGSDLRHHYVVAAVVLFEEDIDPVRKRLGEIRNRLGFPLHYSDLRSKKRRQEAIEAIDSVSEWDVYVFETAEPFRGKEHHVRAKILESAFMHLSTCEGVQRLVLETRSHPSGEFGQLDEKDHQVLHKLVNRGEVPADLEITHKGKSEPLLQVPDVVVGARSDHLCAADREAYAMVSHRVRDIKSV